jgi:hypothetical protein
MSSNTAFDYATPYDIMVGLWTAQKIVYGPKGEYLDSTPSFVAVYWEKRHKLMHFREGKSSKRLARRAAVARMASLEFDLNVDGKYSHGESSKGVKITGTETRPDVYHFHLKDVDGGNWYNNHYLISPNERHVLGPLVEKNGKIEMIVAQTLTRVSYDVPKKYKRKLHRSSK